MWKYRLYMFSKYAKLIGLVALICALLAGLPIRFADVRFALQPDYIAMDTRPYMEMEKIPEGLISRGYRVSNKNAILK